MRKEIADIEEGAQVVEFGDSQLGISEEAENGGGTDSILVHELNWFGKALVTYVFCFGDAATRSVSLVTRTETSVLKIERTQIDSMKRIRKMHEINKIHSRAQERENVPIKLSLDSFRLDGIQIGVLMDTEHSREPQRDIKLLGGVSILENLGEGFELRVASTDRGLVIVVNLFIAT